MLSEQAKAVLPVPDWSFAQACWDSIAFPGGARLLITGGTGFFGRSLLAAIAHLRPHAAPSEVIVLSRSPWTFTSRYPELASLPGVRVVAGALHQLPQWPQAFTHIVHAAIDPTLRGRDEALVDDIESGARSVLALARRDRARLLFTSSGAVYGPLPPECYAMERNMETDAPLTEDLNPYARGKRRAEKLCADAWQATGVPVVVARCFAFVGEYLALDGPHAAADFLRQALTSEHIVVSGSGRAVRSYLHASDLAHWLLALLLRGMPGRAYNVGSDRPVTILTLAHAIGRVVAPGKRVVVHGAADAGMATDWYVPSIHRVRGELGLEVTVPLEDALVRSAGWLRRTAPAALAAARCH